MQKFFFTEEMEFEESYRKSITDIYETLKNDVILKVIINFMNSMEKSPEIAIRKF